MLVYLGQTVGLIKTKIGIEVGLGPAPAPSPKRGTAPLLFGRSLLWPNGWMDQDTTWYGGRPGPRPHCVRWGPSSFPHKKLAQQPPLFGPCLLWPNGRPSQQLQSSCFCFFSIFLVLCLLVYFSTKTVNKDTYNCLSSRFL